nr:immunoglobulin light chain junction region [Macaca mulatta]
CQCAYVMPCTF